MFQSPAQRTFRETLTWRIIAALPFFSLLAFGVYDYLQSHRFESFLWMGIAVSGLLFAFSIVWAAKRLVTIHQEGISYSSLFSNVDLPWEGIKSTSYRQYPVNLAAHLGLIGFLVAAFTGKRSEMQRSLVIVGNKKIKLSANFRDIEEAIRLIFAAVNPRIRKEAEDLLKNSGTYEFGNLALSPQGIIWKKKAPIPYGTVVKCKVDGQMVRIKSEGKWLDTVAVKCEKIPNLFVALEMIEEKRAKAETGPFNKAAVAGLDKFS